MSNYRPVILQTDKGPVTAVMKSEEGGGGGSGGLPAGGAAGNVLTKDSAVDGDASWKTPDAAGLVTTTGNQAISGGKSFNGLVQFNNQVTVTNRAVYSTTARLVLNSKFISGLNTSTPVGEDMLKVVAQGSAITGAGTITIQDSPNVASGQLLFLAFVPDVSSTTSYNIQGDGVVQVSGKLNIAQGEFVIGMFHSYLGKKHWHFIGS